MPPKQASTMPTEQAYIWIIDAAGTRLGIGPGRLPLHLLRTFSTYSRRQLDETTTVDPTMRSLGNTVTVPQGLIDRDAYHRIATWIATNSAYHPRPLLISDTGINGFRDAAHAYAAAHALGVPRTLRGDDVRDACWEYVHQGCLTADEFKLVHELIGFDTGVMKTALNAVMYGRVKGGAAIPPEMAEIEAYARGVGLWERMLEMEEGIRAKIKRN